MLTIPVNLRIAFKAQIKKKKKKRKHQANLATQESCTTLESKVCAFLSLPKVAALPCEPEGASDTLENLGKLRMNSESSLTETPPSHRLCPPGLARSRH